MKLQALAVLVGVESAFAASVQSVPSVGDAVVLPSKAWAALDPKAGGSAVSQSDVAADSMSSTVGELLEPAWRSTS